LSPFQDWSWATTRNAQTATPHYSGSFSYGFVPQDYQAIYFECTQCIDTSLHSSIQFYISGGSSSFNPSGITFALLQGTSPAGPVNPLTSYITVNPVPANTWALGTVSLSAVGFPAGKYDGFWFQDSTGGTQAQVYVDSITVVGK